MLGILGVGLDLLGYAFTIAAETIKLTSPGVFI